MWLGLGIRITNWWRTLSASGPFNGHATLADGLVSVWPISEDGFDVVGANDLTNNNTVTFVAKGVGAPANMPDAVANFVAASSQSFSTGNTILGADANVTASLWFNTDVPGAETLLNDANGDFFVRFTAGQTPHLFVRAFGANVEKAGVLALNAWHHVIAWHDADTNAIGIMVDGGTPATAASGGANGALNTFFVGTGLAQFFNGKISSPTIWSRVLTSDERTDLYNSGDGLFY